MTRKLYFNRPPDLLGQVNENLSNAYQALKSKHPLNWEVLPGIEYLAGFIGTTKEKAEELLESGKITPYENCGEEFYLISQVVAAINSDPSLQNLSWLSYKDNLHTPDDPIIHWIKWKFEGRILVKYLFRKQTFYAILKPELFRKNRKIGDTLLRIINRTLKARRNEKN